jgi:hypothetical protein
MLDQIAPGVLILTRQTKRRGVAGGNSVRNFTERGIWRVVATSGSGLFLLPNLRRSSGPGTPSSWLLRKDG